MSVNWVVSQTSVHNCTLNRTLVFHWLCLPPPGVRVPSRTLKAGRREGAWWRKDINKKTFHYHPISPELAITTLVLNIAPETQHAYSCHVRSLTVRSLTVFCCLRTLLKFGSFNWNARRALRQAWDKLWKPVRQSSRQFEISILLLNPFWEQAIKD